MRFFWKYKLDHVVFWSTTIAFYAYVTSNLIYKTSIFQYSLNILIRNGLLMLICYSNVYYYFPRYFKKGRYALYVASFAGCLLPLGLLCWWWGLCSDTDQATYKYIFAP